MIQSLKYNLKADLEVSFKVKNQRLKMKKGNDLIVIKRINLIDALQAKSFEMETVSGQIESIVVTEIISPSLVIRVPERGFYYFDSNDSDLLCRGDLFVKFDIQFPKELTTQQKSELAEILPGC